MNQQLQVNVGQMELWEMVQALSARPSKNDKGKAPVEPEPSIHSSECVKVKVSNIANYRPEKHAGRMIERSSDVIEVWLHKWEEAFDICEIRFDLKKIRKATHLFIEAADRWWIKQQKDKVAPITWEGFKSEFKKHFLSPDEESRAWDAYRSLRQRNLL